MQSLTAIGNLGADAKVHEVQKGNGEVSKFVSFKIADTQSFTDNKGNEQNTTIWISCTWNGDGGKLLPYLKTGVKVCVIGRPSYRVYSSEKLRAMVAGVELHVRSIELCGGSEELFPKDVADENGVLHKVEQYAFVPTMDKGGVCYGVKGSFKNKQFSVDKKSKNLVLVSDDSDNSVQG